ncbi:MAG TPA: hypothetical protein VK781_04305, partial [Solirubrobacteraceae bacterium]|nr:hypothetical protein [Solirubrobacteraceae bacterium]
MSISDAGSNSEVAAAPELSPATPELSPFAPEPSPAAPELSPVAPEPSPAARMELERHLRSLGEKLNERTGDVVSGILRR